MRRVWVAVTASVVVAGLLASASVAAAPSCFGRPATIVGTGGNDELRGTRGPDVVVAKGGRDRVIGRGGDDVICGGPGKDILEGEGGNDSIDGGGGSDDVIGQAGNDTLLGGGNNDYLEGALGDDDLDGGGGDFDFLGNFNAAGPLAIDMVAGTVVGDGSDTIVNIEMVTGSDADDSIITPDDPEALTLIYPRAGDDTVTGGVGFDQLVFEYATQPVTADLRAGTATGEGSDTFTGVDSIIGSPLGDTLLGTDDFDDLYGIGGNDRISGRGGDDYIVGGPGDDVLEGNEGDYDMVSYFDARGPVVADLSGSTGEGTDTHTGFELLGGSHFDDSLRGNEANNLLFGMGGDDDIDGAGGYDIIIYDLSSRGVTVDLAAGTATGEGKDSLDRIEGVVGTIYDDVLRGDDQGNVIVGLEGNDQLFGAGAGDYFEPGGGDDVVDGGDGPGDMIDYFFSPAGVEVDLTTGEATGEGTDLLLGIEEVLGSIFDDLITGDASPNYLDGGEGDDTIDGGGGDDGLDGGEGSDSLTGGDGADQCFGGESLVECEESVQPEGNPLAQTGQGSSDYSKRHR